MDNRSDENSFSRDRLLSMDSDVLAQVYDQFYPPLYRYISFRINDPQTVEDLTSELFTRFLTSLQRGKAPDNLQAWLYKVARNIVIDHYRASKKTQWDEISDNIASDTDSPDMLTDKTLRNEQIRRGLHHLNETQQHVLTLRFGDGMAIKDVAKLLGKSVGAIKMIQARAIAALGREVQQ